LTETATPQQQPGTGVDVWEQAHAQLSPDARERWTVGEVRTIRNAVAPKLNPAEFQMFMAMAAKYDLDPLAKEIWGSKGKSKNGAEGRVLIMVGRDGLLKVARRDKSYAGFDSDVVRENDLFRVKRSGQGREVVHEYEGDSKKRGAIVGAWAQVYQKGYHETYFYAPAEEYMPSNPDTRSPWHNQPSVMMQKCALALCLRLAFNLSGVVGEEEAERMFEADAPAYEPAADPEDAAKQLGELVPEEVREQYVAVVHTALLEGITSPAMAQMRTVGKSVAEVLAWLDQLEGVDHRKPLEPEEPVDAEVVDATEAEERQMRITVLQREYSDLVDRMEGMDPEQADPQALGQLDQELTAKGQELVAAGGQLP
jgi:phage recombination protein Bet